LKDVIERLNAMSRKSLTALITSLMLILSVFNLAPAKASTDGNCPFGQVSVEAGMDEETDETFYDCNPASWDVTATNDGFDKKTVAIIAEDLAGAPGSTTINELSLILRCTSKKFEAYFASSYVLFDKENRAYSKKLQYKMDTGKVYSTTFSESTDNNAFFVVSPKTFATNLAKGKSKLSIKYASSKGSQISQFPIAGISKFRSKFTSAGCKF
jgi:hypothetical protein